MSRRHIPKEHKELALNLLRREHLPQKLVSRYTNISVRALKRLLHTYRKTGSVIRTPVCNGRPRILDIFEILIACIERRPDMYLTELQEELGEICGTRTSPYTIWRTLRRCGYTLKKVL
ncbi:hypothetical protein K474DRAFT_1594745 [Panus rudis PR-1116 ss-1]|nr:hypothetical protein K474DRAFT_1598010 [Panus rudis PR-1116 ss-1]KAI0078064.1 hypothetical protein K474DRAFT_1594745 [Panus rudis PR-1116 ss-1]